MTEELLLVIGVTTLCMLSPGPDMILVMRNTLTRDRRVGALTAMGVLTGNLFHIGYCALGIALLLSQSPLAFNVLRIASAVYLLYLGIQSLRSTGGFSVDTPTPSDEPRRANAYWQGLLNNLLNPKGSLFYLGVFSQLITPDMTALETVTLIAVMMSVSAAFWVVFVQTLHWPQIRARLAKYGVLVDRAFGLLLVFFAVKVALLS